MSIADVYYLYVMCAMMNRRSKAEMKNRLELKIYIINMFFISLVLLLIIRLIFPMNNISVFVCPCFNYGCGNRVKMFYLGENNVDINIKYVLPIHVALILTYHCRRKIAGVKLLLASDWQNVN